LTTVKQLEMVERKRKEKLEREHKIINGIDYKLCNKHHIFFPEESPWLPATLDYFYYHEKNSTDHLHPECKRCGVKKMYEWRDVHPEYLESEKERTSKKYHSDPEFKQMIIDSSQQQRKDGYQSEWRKDHPEKCIEYSKLHRQHDITEEEWRNELKVFDYGCAYCGMTLEEHLKIHKQKLHKDHVDDEGYNDLRNAVPACRSCNSSKHQHNLDDWYKPKKFYSEERYNKIIWWITEGYKDYIEDKPPYRIIRKQNENNNKYHWQLWSIDNLRNILEVIAIADKKKDIINKIKDGSIIIPID